MVNQSSYKISILIPTYNRLSLFQETLQNVLSQAEGNPVEVVVVDDGSTEGNFYYALELSQRYPFLRVARHEKNLGVAQARHTLLDLMSGEYFLFIDSDDLLLERALKTMLSLLEEGYDVYVLNTLREKGGKLKLKKLPQAFSAFDRLKYFLVGRYSECLYLVRSSLGKRIRPNPCLRVREDFTLKALYLIQDRVKILHQPFAVIRDTPQRLRKTSQFYFEQALIPVEELFSNLPTQFQALKPYALGLTYLELVKRAYRKKDYAMAKEYLNRAKKAYPEIGHGFSYLKYRLKLVLKKYFFILLWGG